MEKGFETVIGSIIIFFSIIFINDYFTTSMFGMAIISTLIGIAGIIFLYLSKKTDEETTILSTGMMMTGGLIVPILPFMEDKATTVTIICYAAAIILLILKPPEKWNNKVPAQQ